MATLSERQTDHKISHTTPNFTNSTGEYIMTLKTVNLTLVDNNPNLKAAQKIVYQSLNLVTEHNDDRTIQQVLITGDVAKALAEHNLKRVKVVDKEILRNTGRDVYLEPVEIFDLKWQVIQVG